MDYRYAFNKNEQKIISKLNTLTDIDTYWDSVSKMCSRVTSDRTIKRYLILSEIRYKELEEVQKWHTKKSLNW